METTVAACQLAIEDLTIETNRERVRECLDSLDSEVDIALFPEQTLTGFVPDERITDVAVRRDGDHLQRLRSLAEDHDTALVVGFVERDGQECYNATAYVDPDGDLTVYRKRHLWGGERDLLTPGEELVTVETPAGEAGLVTCYDLNFVGDSAAHAREDVTALLVVGAWPAAYSENWRLLLRARALDGVRWAVGVGRTGTRDVPDAPPATYAGRSMVARPDGGVHRALDRREGTLVADLDPETLAAKREQIGVFE
jgi:(R)-amidase